LNEILLASLVALCLFAGGITAFVWSGSYNVAANVPHWKITHWFLERVRERSISTHSKGIVVPSLNNPKLIEAGFRNYHEMCRLCHGASGYSQTEIAKGLYPPPPDLTKEESVKDRNDAQFYWVIKNGIKMTGMAAFGPTHEEQELWGIVAFLRKLPGLKPEEYRAMLKAAGMHGEREDDHPHGHKAH
jgi:mono/diheme cytochrome c family protein